MSNDIEKILGEMEAHENGFPNSMSGHRAKTVLKLIKALRVLLEANEFYGYEGHYNGHLLVERGSKAREARQKVQEILGGSDDKED